MEAAELPCLDSSTLEPQTSMPTGSDQPRTRRWSRSEDEWRNQRTIELLSRARDESLSETDRQYWLNLAVELNLSIAESLARRYRSRGEDLDDLIQVARLGLVQAVKRFSPEIGNFVAFAVPTIAGEIKRHFRDHFWSTPRPPRRLQDLHQEAAAAWSDVAQECGHTPTAAEVANRLGANQQDVREAMAATPIISTTLDTLTEASPAASAWLGTPDPGFEAVDDALERDQLRKRLMFVIADLADTDRQILWLRFGRNCTQSAIAAELGISQMSVSRRLAKITQVLREKLSTEPLQRCHDECHSGQPARPSRVTTRHQDG